MAIQAQIYVHVCVCFIYRCTFIIMLSYVQMEIQHFKEPVLADIRNLQLEKAELEKVRVTT